jgi:hypothetical protein
MALFSSKKSVTENKTEYNYTDQSQNAAEGAIAVGTGGFVNIETADPDVALGALDANSAVSQRSLDTAGAVSFAALNANRDVNLRSLDTTSAVAAAAINQIAGVQDIASRERSDVINATNLALNNSKGAQDQLTQLASAALERSQTPDSAVTKQLLWVVGGVLALFGLLLFSKRSASAK